MTQLTESPPQTAAAVIEESTFTAADGAGLFYRHWIPERATERALILFHRGHEHSGRFAEFVKDLNLPDCHVFAWDARGHGRSPGERGYAESFSVVIDDVDQFIRFISERHELKISEMVVLGHSVGAVAVAAWVHDYAPPVRAMVLVTPAFRVKLYVPLAMPALRLRNRFGKSFIKSYVKAKVLTHDPQQAAAYQADSLLSRNIATNILLDLYDTSTRLLADAGAIRTPTLLLSAGSDWVVQNSAQQKFFHRLSSPVKSIKTYDGFYHAILQEKDRVRPISEIRTFIEQAFSQPIENQNLLDSYRAGYTLDEFNALSKPLPTGSLRWCNYAMQRLNLKTICRLSNGVRLGWGTGFDSGETLDYVYRNQPSGTSPLGRFIDRQYLNSVGWAGIRTRKLHLQLLLREAIQQTKAAGQPVRILDIAGGGGRYLLEVLGDRGADISALIRDRSSSALETGRQTARSMQLNNVTFAQGDAFDGESLASIEPKPTIGIVSGLYELFGDNELIRASLSGLARAIPPGGFLIYTNQPWHPQIEMIARTLTNRDGKPWIMRRRTQAEMDALVQSAGFEKLRMKIDKNGIFTVSLAIRTPLATQEIK